MTVTRDELTTARKEKRWILLKKPAGMFGGELTFASATHPLGITMVEAHMNEGSFVAATKIDLQAEEAWLVDSELSSFDEVKARTVELAKTYGLERIKIVRPVDLYTVLYPIS